jgi:hypothetical protein
MAEIQLTTLVDYQRRLTAMNFRQQQAALVQAPGIVLRFAVSDFDNIDQGQSTATIRADAGTANLRERRQPDQVLVNTTQFSSSVGTVQSIDSDSTLFSVYSPNGVPVGTFNMTLATVVGVSFLSIDVSAMASSPIIEVQISSNGLTWTPATTISLTGSTLSVWLPEALTKYIQVVMTPTHPDNLGGSTYTFGITDLSGTSVDYNLVSDAYFVPQTFFVQTPQVQLVGEDDPNITYFLTLGDANDASIVPVNIVATPNTPISLPNLTFNNELLPITSGIVGESSSFLLPNTGLIEQSVEVFTSEGVQLPVVWGLSPTDTHKSDVTSQIAVINEVEGPGYQIQIVPTPENGLHFRVEYYTGTVQILATLQVHLSTSDRTVTPVFSGAYLENIS